MTDFNSWLEGFLEGKNTLSKDEIELIRTKIPISNTQYHQPFFNNPIDYYYTPPVTITSSPNYGNDPYYLYPKNETRINEKRYNIHPRAIRSGA